MLKVSRDGTKEPDCISSVASKLPVLSVQEVTISVALLIPHQHIEDAEMTSTQQLQIIKDVGSSIHKVHTYTIHMIVLT